MLPHQGLQRIPTTTGVRNSGPLSLYHGVGWTILMSGFDYDSRGSASGIVPLMQIQAIPKGNSNRATLPKTQFKWVPASPVKGRLFAGESGLWLPVSSSMHRSTPNPAPAPNPPYPIPSRLTSQSNLIHALPYCAWTNSISHHQRNPGFG